jgi:DHA1 family inner membrane transport protein
LPVDAVATRGQQRPRATLSLPILCALIVTGLAATTNAQVFALLLAPIAADFGTSVARLGALRAVEELVAIGTGLALAPFIDRTTRKRLLLAGLALMALAALTGALATSPWILLSFFVLDGVSKILLFSTILAMPGDLAQGRALDRALGFVIGSFALSGFTVVPLVGLVAGAFSWRAGFVIAASVAALACLLVVALIPSLLPSATPHASPVAHLRAIARLPGLMLALIGAFLRFLLFAGTFTYVGAFLIDHHGSSVARAGLYLSIGSLAFLGASIASGYLLRFIGVTRTLVGGCVLSSALLVNAFSLDLRLLYAGLGLIGVAALLAILENASTGLLLRLAPGHRGAAMSLNELCAAAGSLLGISFGALLLRLAGFAGVGILLAVVGILSAAITFAAIRASMSPRRPLRPFSVAN